MYGISFDTAEENKAFADKFDFPFGLLSDPSRTISLAYAACDDGEAKYPKRYTYVIGPSGVIEHAIDTKDPAGQADDILSRL